MSGGATTFATGIGLLSHRVGRKPFLVVVPLLAAVSAVVFAAARAPALLFLFAALGSFGRGQGAGGGTVGPYQPAETAFVAEGVPTSARAAAFGRLAFASSVGALVGSLLAGLAHTHPHKTHAAATAAPTAVLGRSPTPVHPGRRRGCTGGTVPLVDQAGQEP